MAGDEAAWVIAVVVSISIILIVVTVIIVIAVVTHMECLGNVTTAPSEESSSGSDSPPESKFLKPLPAQVISISTTPTKVTLSSLDTIVHWNNGSKINA